MSQDQGEGGEENGDLTQFVSQDPSELTDVSLQSMYRLLV